MSSKFLGQTKGHSGNAPNLSTGMGTTGESHSGGPSSKFIGTTKGNKDLPINRTEGVSMGHGGKTTQRC
jgi:hypothetical protein